MSPSLLLTVVASLLVILLVLASIWTALAILSEIDDLAYWLRRRWFE